MPIVSDPKNRLYPKAFPAAVGEAPGYPRQTATCRFWRDHRKPVLEIASRQCLIRLDVAFSKFTDGYICGCTKFIQFIQPPVVQAAFSAKPEFRDGGDAGAFKTELIPTDDLVFAVIKTKAVSWGIAECGCVGIISRIVDDGQ